MAFVGTVVITQNPVTGWERYHRTLGISVDRGAIGYRNLSVEERAESGYYRCRFRLYGPREFLSEFLVDSLSRQIEIFHPDGRKKWEGMVYEMKLETGSATMRTSLDDLANKVWARYRITGAGVTSRSTVMEDSASQNRYGIKEFILGCGELEAAAVADQVAQQYLDLHKNPTPAPTSIKIGKGLIAEPYIEVEGRGFFETLYWRVWNNTGAAASQGASAQIGDIIGEREGVEIGYPAVWDQTADFEEGDLTDFDALSPGLTWDQEFDEQIADFDAISPTWDKHADFEEGDTSDFDAEVDADGDLNAAMAAAHDGTWGIEITFDDANVAYGQLNALAINQTTGCISLWFDPNTVTLGNGKMITIVETRDGAAAGTWGIQLYNNAGTYQARPIYYDDAPALQGGTWQSIADAYRHLLIMFSRSTGAGNDDGWMRFYIDGVLAQNWIGHDNDTRDWDNCLFGMIWTDQIAGFGGSFYMDELYIDPIGAPMVNTLAAKEGTYGVMVPIADTTVRYMQFTDPVANTVCTWESWINLDNLTMTNGDVFRIGYLYDAVTPVALLRITQTTGIKQIGFAIKNDAGVYTWSSYYSLNPGWNHVRFMWAAATGAGNDDGYGHLFLNAAHSESITGFDNDTRDVESVYFFAGDTLDAGTYGLIYFDDCRWDADVGPMGAYSFAQKVGSYGMAVFIPNTTARYGELTDPTDETEITIECWIDFNSITMSNGDAFAIIEGIGSGAVATSVRVNLERIGGVYELTLAVYDDSSVLLTSEPIAITDKWHLIRVVWKASTGAGNDDGRAYLFIDNGKVVKIEDIDNDGYDVDSVRFGAVSGLDTGIIGVLLLDNCRWSDDTVITVTSESGVAQFVAQSELRTNSTLVSKIYDADRKAGDIVADIARLGDAGYKRWLVYMTDGRTFVYEQATPAERN